MDNPIQVIATRTKDLKWWAIEAPDVPGVHSQCRRVSEIEEYALEAISMVLDVPEDSLEIEVSYRVKALRVPNGFGAELKARKEEADRAKAEYEEERDRVIKELAAADIPYRDIGAMTGISHQRVGQLVKAD